MSTDILGLDELEESQASKYLTHNKALRQLEAELVRVLSRSNSGPPTSPSDGDVYIVDSLTGDWSTATLNDIAHYYSSAWHNYTPLEGLSLWCVDEGIRIKYTGSAWEAAYSYQLDISKTLADGEYSGIIDIKTVDSNSVGFAAALYLASDGHLEEACALISPECLPCIALALETGTGSKKVLRQGRIRNDAWSWTVGERLYVSTAEGELEEESPSGANEQLIGIAEASNIIYFNPSLEII